MKKQYFRAAAMTAMLLSGTALARAESLTLYCAADEAWCQQIKTDFEEKTGITVDMTRKSSGETYAQVARRGRQPEGRRLVGRHRRPASAGGRGRPDRGL